MVRGWQGDRAVAGVDVADSQRLGHRAGADLQSSARHHDVASSSSLRDRGELGGDAVFSRLTQLFGRGSGPGTRDW